MEKEKKKNLSFLQVIELYKHKILKKLFIY
jgi:hypothetical protein